MADRITQLQDTVNQVKIVKQLIRQTHQCSYPYHFYTNLARRKYV